MTTTDVFKLHSLMNQYLGKHTHRSSNTHNNIAYLPQYKHKSSPYSLQNYSLNTFNEQRHNKINTQNQKIDTQNIPFSQNYQIIHIIEKKISDQPQQQVKNLTPILDQVSTDMIQEQLLPEQGKQTQTIPSKTAQIKENQLPSRVKQCIKCVEMTSNCQEDKKIVQCCSCFKQLICFCHSDSVNKIPSNPICSKCNRQTRTFFSKLLSKTTKRIKKAQRVQKVHPLSKPKKLQPISLKQREQKLYYLQSFLSSFGYKMSLVEQQIVKDIKTLKEDTNIFVSTTRR